MRFLLLLALLSSCSRKTVYSYPPMPANMATTEQKADITDELDRLEKDFASIDVHVDLNEIPVVVSALPFGVVGRCQYGKKDKGAYIILSPLLFPSPNFQPLDANLFEKDFVRVLIHEIGHCYFHRQHEPPQFLESPGNSFELHYQGTSVVFDKIPTSVMPAESSYRMPKALRMYYLSELVGKAKLTNMIVLEDYADYSFVSNEVQPEIWPPPTTTPATSDTVQPTEKEGSDVTELLEGPGPEHAS